MYDENNQSNFSNDVQDIANQAKNAKKAINGTKKAINGAKKLAQKKGKEAVAAAVKKKAAAAILAGASPILIIVAIILLVLMIVSVILYPLSISRYGDEVSATVTGEEAPTVGVNGFNTSDKKYNFLSNMYEFSEATENLVFNILHPIQAKQARDEIEKLQTGKYKVPEININEEGKAEGDEYTRSAISMITSMDAAFQKGWSRTMATAKARAEKIVETKDGKNKIVKDKHINEIIWDERKDFWDKTNLWKSNDNEYEAGTFPKDKDTEYVGEYEGEKTTINMVYSCKNDGNLPPYIIPELQIAVLQNCALQSYKNLDIIYQDGLPTVNPDKNAEVGINIQYDDDDDALAHEDTEGRRPNIDDMDTTTNVQYQVLRLAGEIAGRGIKIGDLDDANHTEENESIYVIDVSTKVEPKVNKVDVTRKEFKGYEQKVVGYEQKIIGYEQKQKMKKVGNIWIPVFVNGKPVYEDDYNRPIYGDDTSKPIYGDDTSKPIYEYPYDHTDVWTEVTATVEYELKIKPNTKSLIETKMKNRMNEAEAKAFDEAVAGYYRFQFGNYNEEWENDAEKSKENFGLCGLFKVNPQEAGGGWIEGGDDLFEDIGGKLAWPLPQGVGHLTRGFTPQHKGFDWAAAGGTPIFAVESGVVVVSEHEDSWGYHVRIKHGAEIGNIQTNYAHMIQVPSVAAGETVTRGQLIGYVGSTGNSSGNHLHLEVWTGPNSSSRIDPAPFFPDKVLHNENG